VTVKMPDGSRQPCGTSAIISHDGRRRLSTAQIAKTLGAPLTTAAGPNRMPDAADLHCHSA